MPRSLGKIRFATGFGKWGLSERARRGPAPDGRDHGVPSSDRPEWMSTIAHRLTCPPTSAAAEWRTCHVGWEATAGWVGAQFAPVPVVQPEEGQGVVATRGGHPVGISTVGGTTRAVSLVCTHLGGVPTWNDAECTWDCPLHASRFAPDGTRIEGPALRDLAPPAPGPDRRTDR